MNDSVNPQQPGPKQVRNARIKLVALLSVFLLPFIAAIITHSLYRDSGELSTSSYGELILPAVPLTAFSCAIRVHKPRGSVVVKAALDVGVSGR